MKHPRLLWLIPLATSAVFVAGCGQKVTIKTTNGTATGTVDVDKQSANLNINGSTLVTGNKVQLPADFPSDVYIISGTIKTAVSTPNISDTVAIEATPSMSAANELYKTKLVENGWTITTSGVIDVHSAAIMATKDTRSVTVSISDTDGPTVVMISVVKSPSTPSTPNP